MHIRTTIIDNSKTQLKQRVLRDSKNDIETARKLYGQIGADIFQKKQPTILSPEEQKSNNSILNKIKISLGMDIPHYADYEEKDTLASIISKYTCNRKSVLPIEILDLFGEKGLEHFKTILSVGLIK